MNEKGGEFIKFDVSKLDGRGNVLPKKVEERVFLGSDNEGFYRRQISKLADEMEKEKVFDESNPDRSTNVSNILKNNFNMASLGDLRDAQQDANREYLRENLKKSEERLAKAVLVALKETGMKESDLVSPNKVETKLPEELKGLGEKVASFVITDSKIKESLKKVDLYKNDLQIDNFDEKKDLVLEQIDYSLKEIRKSINLENIKQVELASNYLNSLKLEVTRNREKESITDEIVTFLDSHVIRRDVTVDEDLNLRNLHGGDDFEIEIKDGKEVILPNGEKKYKNPEAVAWLRDRKQKATDLILICSGGEFSSIDEINEKLNEGSLLGPYYTKGDGSRGEKDYLEGLKDTLGFCIYETIQDSRVVANQTILGTLNTNRIDSLLPMEMAGLSDNVVINAAKDPFLREQLRKICLLDKDKEFSLLKIEGGFSDGTAPENLRKEINSIITKITGDKRMGVDEAYTDEAKRIQNWLIERNEIYKKIAERQEKMGRYGEIIPETTKERFDMARNLLNTVEASGSPPGSLNIMDQCTKLFNMTQSEKVEPELKTEIGARLRLSFMFYHMHAAGGLLNNRGQSMEDAHEQGFKEGLLIDKDAMAFFLKEETNGLPVAECWDAIEDINFGDNYYKMLKRIMGISYNPNTGEAILGQLTESNEQGKFLLSIKKDGLKYLGINKSLSDTDYLAKWDQIANPKAEKSKQITYRFNFFKGFDEIQNEESIFWGKDSKVQAPMCKNHFTDTNNSRKAMVKDFILGEIKTKRETENVGKAESNKKPTDKNTLQKGYELAEKLMEATAETSVFNPCFAGHNDFSELILTEANTRDRQKKLKTIGYRVVMDEVVSLYTTFPRYIAGETKAERKSVFGPLHANEIITDRMSEPQNDSYFLYTAILPKKILPVQAALMKEDVGTKDVLSVEYWKKLYDPISKVMNYGQHILAESHNSFAVSTEKNKEALAYRLRVLAVKSVLQAAARFSNNWNWGDIRSLGEIVTQEYVTKTLPNNMANKVSFITVKDWTNLRNDISFVEEMNLRLTQLQKIQAEKDSEKTPDLSGYLGSKRK